NPLIRASGRGGGTDGGDGRAVGDYVPRRAHRAAVAGEARDRTRFAAWSIRAFLMADLVVARAPGVEIATIPTVATFTSRAGGTRVAACSAVREGQYRQRPCSDPLPRDRAAGTAVARMSG